MKESLILADRPATKIQTVVMDAAQTAALTMDTVADLRRLGINLPPRRVADMIRNLDIAGMAMDDTTGLVTTASISNPVQFLQAWLPGLVRVLTAARKADELIGIQTVGSWEDEEVIQGMLEPTGDAQLYGDHNSIPLASWNMAWERRTIVRWEKGFQVGLLEEARSARIRINSAAEKRNAAALALDIRRNLTAFLGFNGGTNRTYGILNDPSLPAYVNVAGGTWSAKTFLQITADIRSAMAALENQAQGLIDVEKTPITLGLALAVHQYLSVTSDYGNSVREWLRETYPNVRIVTVPEFNAANGGANVFYLFADRVEDSGTDGGNTWAQLVPAKFQALGTEKRAKGYVEDFSNATAGVLLKRPYAIVRRSGV
jgi:Uncharacterized protein conserved in bacteria (DUF2184)